MNSVRKIFTHFQTLTHKSLWTSANRRIDIKSKTNNFNPIVYAIRNFKNPNSRVKVWFRDVGGGSAGNTGSRKFSIILKSLAFTGIFGAGCYSCAVIANYERRRYNQMNLNEPQKSKYSEFRNNINNFWNGLSNVKKAVIVLISLNAAVFVCWHLRSFQNAMLKYFILEPFSGRYSQMVFSTFSHQQIFHVGLNMLALYSLSHSLGNILPVEQFLAFYLSAGVFASLFSNVFKVLTSTINPSLGASGAIISCFALTSLIYPKSQFYIIPFPFPIEAETLLKCLVGFDLICLFLGFRRLDHAAHLGGVLYAYLFLNLEKKHLYKFQEKVVSEWKKIR